MWRSFSDRQTSSRQVNVKIILYKSLSFPYVINFLNFPMTMAKEDFKTGNFMTIGDAEGDA